MENEDGMDLTRQLARGISILRVESGQHPDSRTPHHWTTWTTTVRKKSMTKSPQLINDSGLANHAKAYVVAQLGIFTFDTSGEDIDIPLSEDFG